jgi:hypothetical protein
MKHIKLFEQYVAEAKTVKELEADLRELEDRMEEIQAAADAGKMDPDEAELELSDLDGYKMEMEKELDDLKKGGKKSGGSNAKKLKELAWTYTGFRAGGHKDYADSTLFRYEADGTSDKPAKAKLLKIAAKLEKQEVMQLKKSDDAKQKFDVMYKASEAKLSSDEKKYLDWLVSPSRIKAQSEEGYIKKKLEIAQKLCKQYNTKCEDVKELSAKLSSLKGSSYAEYEKTQELATKAGLNRH